MVREVPRVVGEVLPQQRHRHRIEFDARDAPGAERERDQQLDPPGGPDHQDARLGLGHGEGQRSVAVGELVANGLEVAREAPQVGAVLPVVDQPLPRRPGDPGLRHVDPEHRMPAPEDGRELPVGGLVASHGLDRIHHRIGERLVPHGAEPQQQREAHERGTPHAALRQPQARGGHRRAAQEDASRWAQHDHRRDGGGAAQPGAGEIGAVEPVEGLHLQREDARDGEPDHQEAREERQADGGQAHQRGRCGGWLVGAHLQRRDGEVAEPDGEAARQREPRQQALRRRLSQLPEERHEDPTGPDPEHGEADDEIGEVGGELEREDPRVADLEQQRSEGDQEDLQVAGLPRHVGRLLQVAQCAQLRVAVGIGAGFELRGQCHRPLLAHQRGPRGDRAVGVGVDESLQVARLQLFLGIAVEIALLARVVLQVEVVVAKAALRRAADQLAPADPDRERRLLGSFGLRVPGLAVDRRVVAGCGSFLAGQQVGEAPSHQPLGSGHAG